MGMMPLAVGLSLAGWRVSGEDDHLHFDVAEHLKNAGVRIKSLEDFGASVLPDTVVYSSAVGSEHPARLLADERGIRCYTRGEFLAGLAAHKQLVAVCGSHGKSSTAAMMAHCVHVSIGLVDYYVGAKVWGNWFPSAKLFGNPYLIAELDESDGSHLGFEPSYLCILNIDWDHSDKYPSEAEYRDSFYTLAAKAKRVVWVPEVEVDVFKTKVQPGVEVCGLPTGDDYVAYNENAAKLILTELNLPEVVIDFENFQGLDRRKECLWRNRDASSLWHDYAHHPKEIAAFIDWLRSHNSDSKLEVYFEPHRYSRTLSLASEIIEALQGADKVGLLPVYGAGEDALNYDPSVLEAAIQKSEKEIVQYASMSELFSELRGESNFPDYTTRVFIGAGTIDILGGAYCTYLYGDKASFAEVVNVRTALNFVREHEPLSGKTTMRVGGNARYYAEPPCRESLRYLMKMAHLWGIPLFFLGKGSNLIIPDSGIDSCVVRLNKPEWLQVKSVDDRNLKVGAGVRLRDICKQAEKARMAGFEFMEGIPASLGGALRMNAGAMGGWMSDVIESIEVMTLDGTIRHLAQDELNYGYRSIDELKDCVALSAKLKPTGQATRREVKDQLLQYMQQRKKSQPREASAGCIFKNPEGDKAGRLIDQCGLKGKRFGDAQVSDVHANFIVNLGNASSEDIMQLVQHIRTEVKAQTGILLEPEAVLVGSDWEEALS